MLQFKHLEHLRIRLGDIQLATKDFSYRYCFESDKYSIVYKAELPIRYRHSFLEIVEKNYEQTKKHMIVAIRRYLDIEDTLVRQMFNAEIETLSILKHRNIVSLYGFCDEGPHMIIVYEHASNRSLDYHLGNTMMRTNLTWVQRIRICIGIAHGLNYIHSLEDEQTIIHRDIKTANILLNKKWEAIIDGFGPYKFHLANQQVRSLNRGMSIGTAAYRDPACTMRAISREASDIYTLGVILCEILCWRPAYDPIFWADGGLASCVRKRFSDGTLDEMVDPKLNEEAGETIFSKGVDQESLKTFSKIAYQCLNYLHERPTMQNVINELKKALYFQENNTGSLQISLDDIKMATRNFSRDNLIGEGGFGQVYKGVVPQTYAHNIIAVKQWDMKSDQGETEFMTELGILIEYKHENVVGLVGYCEEMGEKVIVYEYASRGSLDRWLQHDGLTWTKRLEICIDIASGLEFLHGTSDVKPVVVMHRDIKSANVLLHEDWKAKIADFGLSLKSPINQEMNYVIDNAKGTSGYCDPLYITTSMLTKESDIYSLGVLLFEILCGRFVNEYKINDTRNLVRLVRHHCEEGILYEMVFDSLKKDIVPESLTTFQSIAYQCIHEDREKRPTAINLLEELKKALEFQEDLKIWEPKLPKDYKQLIQMSTSPEIYSALSKKDFYNMLFKGILLQKGRVWFSLGTNKERNEMISATKFSYKNRRSHKWASIQQSRFDKVAEISDISNLKIRIKIKTQFLSPGLNYGVYLVFKFCGLRKTSSRTMYVNLTYKMDNETLHSYFATWRDDGWMMIELSRFMNQEEEYYFEVLLESFSRCYCKSHAIYVEGIEFRAIENVKNLLIEKDEKLLSLRNVNETKHHMISAKEAVYDSLNAKLFYSKPSAAEFRFKEVIEVLREQVLQIKCKIESQIMSPNTEYGCYLVFKLSEKRCGLHCPVIVRDLLDWKNEKSGILYFRSPNPLNLHDINQLPEQREDGAMEIIVWKFNSNSKSRNGYVPVNLKLISYEGTMSGLIVYGLEFRPV